MMLKSTYKPSAAAASTALPPGWTEHPAPTGHKYYYHAESKTSTYNRPVVEAAQTEQASAWSSSPYANAPSLADPNVANAYLAQFNQPPASQRGGYGAGRGGGRGGFEGRPKPQPVDKPRRKEEIPGHEPWILVYTKYSRRFIYNPVKNVSYWRIPEKLMEGILELDKRRIRDKAAGDDKPQTEDTKAEEEEKEPQTIKEQEPAAADYDSSEYEEVEVTDDEGDEDAVDGEHRSKRQRTEDSEDAGPVEFTEDDIAAQLQAMGEDYGLEPGEYDDGNPDEWPEGAEGLEFSEDDAKFLFKDLLNDFSINPYSPWDKLLEEGKIVDDPRYTALTTTKARRDCWDEWSREKIADLKEQRAKQEKKDPRIGYMAFLQEKASPKLYWPEFKRKYKKEEAMKDHNLSDKDREKAYREHISRLKMPQPKLKSDLTALLKAQPIHLLNNKSLSDGLPTQILVDARYMSLASQIRDPLVEAYVQTLPPPPEDLDAAAEDDEERRKAREARDKREKALEERNMAVEEQRRRRERELAASKARLRDEEMELEMAMRVGKRGLQSQLATMQKDGGKDAS